MGLGGDIERFYAGLEPVGERYVRCCCHVRDRQASSERGSTDVTSARRSGRVPRVNRSESRSNKRKDEQNMYMYTYRDQDGRMGGRDESGGLSCLLDQSADCNVGCVGDNGNFRKGHVEEMTKKPKKILSGRQKNRPVQPLITEHKVHPRSHLPISCQLLVRHCVQFIIHACTQPSCILPNTSVQWPSEPS